MQDFHGHWAAVPSKTVGIACQIQVRCGLPISYISEEPIQFNLSFGSTLVVHFVFRFFFLKIMFFFYILMGVRASLYVPRLILEDSEVNDQINFQ
jgi:hypothetical protein